MDKYIEKMPKAELHCHLDGSIPLETLYKFAERDNLNINLMDEVVAPDKCENLEEYLKSFDNALSVLQSKENLTEGTYALIESVNKENVRYIEIRFAPLLHMSGGLTVDEVINAVCEGVKRGMKDFTTLVNLLISCMRGEEDEINHKLINAISNLEQELIAGFDFAGNEVDNANDYIGDLTDSIQENGFQLTLHSGECGCAHNITQAIKLGAKRIGHGVAIKNEPNLLSFAKANDIHFELCPTSNYQTNAIKNYEDLPLKVMLKKNISCSINTDNRTVSNTNLTNEFKLVKRKFDLTNEEIYNLSVNAIAYSFARDSIKNKVRDEMTEYFSKNNIYQSNCDLK